MKYLNNAFDSNFILCRRKLFGHGDCFYQIMDFYRYVQRMGGYFLSRVSDLEMDARRRGLLIHLNARLETLGEGGSQGMGRAIFHAIPREKRK